MTAVDIEIEQSHAHNLPEEIHDGNVEQAEQEEPEGAEIEGQQSVPENDGQRLVVELLADTLRNVFRSTELLTQLLHQALELGSRLLLFLGVVDVRLLEVALRPLVSLGGHLVVDFLLALGIVELGALFALQEEQMHLNVVVGQTLLASQSGNTRDDAQNVDDDGGNDGVLLRIVDAQERKFDVVVQVETIHQGMVDGNEPGKACHTVEDASHAALLTRHSCQLAVSTVEDVGNHQQNDGDDVHHQSPRAAIVEAAAGKEESAGSTDYHRPDGNGVGMHVELVESQCAIIAERTDDMEVKPVFRL